ncbi:MAG: serpin family protein, partial [Ilumatobacteraceae bacterium]
TSAAVTKPSLGTTATTPGAGDRSAFVQGNVERTVTDVDQAAAAVQSVNSFGADLYARLHSAKPNQNLVFSPASIAIALAMTSAGARGSTLDQIDHVLHVDDPHGIHHSMNALSAALATRNATGKVGGENATVTLSVVNSLWGQAGFEFVPAFLDLLAGEYGAGMNLVDYEHDPESARADINEWVDKATNQRIPQLLGPGTLTRDSRLTLVNAIYLKARWSSTFSDGNTKPTPFHVSADRTVQAAMMRQTGHFGYAQGAGWSAVDLPYVFDDLSMTVIVADEGGATGAAPALPDITTVVAALETREVRLGFPKFDFKTSTSLADVLRQMGIIDAFSASADFTGMTTSAALSIADVIHQANITVDENGTEAAAATAVIAVATAAPAPSEPIVLTVDRPFLFALRDRPTGAVVFLGRVADPTAA